MLLARAATLVLAALVLETALGAQGSSTPAPGDEDQGVPTEQGAAGTGSVTVQVGYFDQDDKGDGNPFLDEDLTIIEPVVILDYNVTDTFGVYAKLTYDDVSSASIDRLSDYPEQSGASGDDYYGLEFGARHLWSDRTWLGWHLSASTEYDYNSLGAGASVSFEPESTDAKLTFSLNGFFDEIDVIRYDGSEDGTDDRTSIAATVLWYQVLSPEMHGEFGATLSNQTGFLETPYNSVVIEDDALPPNPNLDNEARGYEIEEELPNDRFRAALFGKVRRYVNQRTAVELGGRVYNDDWGITGLSIEPSVYRDLIEDRLRLRLRYRYYDQTEADYFDDSFTKEKNDRTQDSDLGEFHSHTFGAKLTWFTGGGSTLSLAGDYVDRSDGLDSILAAAAWSWSF